MPRYRTTEPVSFVKEGKVHSVKADREVELDEETARSLAGKVLNVERKTVSMFPGGSPQIPVHIVRPAHAHPIAGEPVAPAAPKVEPRVVKAQPKVDSKPEVK